MLLLSRRGYHADMAENTMAAFEAALRFGADGIETDSSAGAACGNYVCGAVTRAEHQHCATLGLAGLITDYPLHVLGRRQVRVRGER